jgi:hypothetical protein
VARERRLFSVFARGGGLVAGCVRLEGSPAGMASSEVVEDDVSAAAAAVANGAADVRRRVRLLVPSPPQPSLSLSDLR